MLLASCSDDNFAPAAPDGGNVSFTIEIPGGYGSRAFADGYTAKNLVYAVYDSNGKLVMEDDTNTFGANEHSTTVSMQLVNGNSYSIAFFAHNATPANAVYTFDAAGKKVTVDYGNMAEYNSVDHDAFYAVENITVSGAINKTVELKRPLAQINWGTNDLDNEFVTADGAYGADAAKLKSRVEIKGVYAAFDILTGEVDESTLTDVTFPAMERPDETKEAFPISTHKYLSMNYVLVPAAQSSLIEATLIPSNDVKDSEPVKVANLPVQANYRTNIYGALLTVPGEFLIVKDKNFAVGDNDIEIVEKGKVKYGDKMYATLADAIKAADDAGVEAAEITVGEGEFISTDITLPNNSNIKKLTINGQGDKTVFIKDAGQTVIQNGRVDLTLNRVKINTSGDNYNGFYHVNSETYNNCTIQNVLFLYGKTSTFNNCIFNVDSDRLASNYNVWTYGSNNASFTDCSFNAAKSMLIYCEDATLAQTVNVTNCTFNGQKLNDGKAAIEVDCDRFTTGSYIINLNGCKATGYDNGNLSGLQLWNVKSGEKFTINVDGEEVKQGITTPKRSEKVYHVNTAEGLVHLSDVITNGYYKDNELKNDFSVGREFILTSDIDMSGIEFIPIGRLALEFGFRGTFDGGNHTISNLTASDFTPENAAAGLFGKLYGNVKNLILKDVNIKSSHWAGGIAGYVGDETGAIIENCKVIGGTVTSIPEQIGSKWDNGDKAGGIIGYGCIGADKVQNCSVENITITCYRHGGAIVGYANTVNNVTGNAAKDVVIKWDNSHDYKNFGATSVGQDIFGCIVGNNPNFTGDNTATNVEIPE